MLYTDWPTYIMQKNQELRIFEYKCKVGNNIIFNNSHGLQSFGFPIFILLIYSTVKQFGKLTSISYMLTFAVVQFCLAESI